MPSHYNDPLQLGPLGTVAAGAQSFDQNRFDAYTGAGLNPNTGARLDPGLLQKGGAVDIGIGAIGTLGSLWNSFQQNKLAKKSLAFQEKTFDINLRNNTKTYNTQLEDRIRARYNTEGRSGEADAKIEQDRLSTL